MKMFKHDGETFLWVMEGKTAVLPHGVNRIKRLQVKESGEIEVISRCRPVQHNDLKSIWKRVGLA